jgi:hypothetical protein
MSGHFSRTTGWLLTAILAVALVLRLGAGAWWQERLPAGSKFAFGDSEGYWVLARTIARGEPYEYGADRSKIFRTPGYPAVLAPLFLLSDEPPVFWGRAVSAVLGTAAVGGVAGLAWLLFDQRTALVAAGIAAVYPEAIATGVFVLSEAPFTPLMMLHLICWTLAWRAKNFSHAAGWSFGAGIAGGLATLMRPSWLLFVPFAAVVGLGIAMIPDSSRNATEGVPSRNWRRHAAIVAIMLLGLCLTMTPWWVRNYQVAGRFVPTSLQVGASLYDGLSPIATGASDMRFVPEFLAEQQAADAAAEGKPSGLFEDRLDRRLRDASLAWARQNIGQALRLAAVKFGRMWNPLPNASEFQNRMLRVILAATYTPVLLLAVVGAWRFARRDWPYLLCLLPAVYFTCLHVVFVSSIRYRQPVMLPLIVLAAAVLIRLTHREADASRSPDL